MIPNLNALARLAFDEAEFKESQHPRDKDGKFTSGGGSSGTGPSSMNKPVQVSTTIGTPLSKAGFKKVKQPGPNGSVTYFHPSGVKVHVHPAPEGKKYSSKWTHEAEGAQTQGEGSKLEQLLAKLVQKAEAKKAEPVKSKPEGTFTFKPNGSSNAEKIQDLEHKGWKYVGSSADGSKTIFGGAGAGCIFDHKTGEATTYINFSEAEEVLGKKVPEPSSSSLSESAQALVKASGEFAKEQGYKPAEVNGAEVIYTKDNGAKLKFDAETGKWVASTPGHMTKEGTSLDKLKQLMTTKTVPPGVTNSQEVIQTKAEQAAMSEQQKAAQEAQKKAQAEYKTLKSTYHKLVAQAPHPTATQQNAIAKYSGSGYSQWNDKLRHDPNFHKTDPLTKHLDDYLNNATFEEDFTVTRKVDGDYAKILKSIIFEGTKFIDRGYVSTSATGQWSGSLKFIITIKKGQKGAAIGKWSHHPSEDEVLLPRNSAFVVKQYDPHNSVIHVDLDQSHFEEKKAAA